MGFLTQTSLLVLFLCGVWAKEESLFAPQDEAVIQLMDTYFSDSRHYLSGRKDLEKARELIFQRMGNAGLETRMLDFPTVLSGGSQHHFNATIVEGLNKGKYWGTDKDRILLIGADYDTDFDVNNIIVDSSGIVALIQLIDLFKRHTCQKLYTTVLLANMMKPGHVGAGGESGAGYYLNNVLLPHLTKSNSTFLGAYFLDSVGNSNSKPNSQVISDGFHEAFPETETLITNNAKKGNFMAVVARHNTGDIGLLDSFRESWGASANPVYSFAMKTGVHQVDEWFQQQHLPFWETNSNRNITSVLLTDTDINRELEKECSKDHCSAREIMTQENLNFLNRTSESLNKLVLNAQCGACSNYISKLSGLMLLFVIIKNYYSF